MGQSQSAHAASAATPEQLSRQLAQRLAEKCFTPLELTHFKSNFVALADEQDGLQYWKEDTLCRFLQIPDILGANHVLGQMLAYLGAWPFSSLAPAILTREALCKIVALLTRRHERVLKGGRRDRAKLVFRSLAVFDRRMSQVEKPELYTEHDTEKNIKTARLESPTHAAGFAVDQPGNDEEDEDSDDLALSALESLDAVEALSFEKQQPVRTDGRLHRAQIPYDNFRSLLLLLLLVAPLGIEEPLSFLAERASEANMDAMHRIADSILWSFAPEKHAGITYSSFNTIVNTSLPFLFEGLNPLFEHFLFSKQLDLSRLKRSSSGPSHPPSSPPNDYSKPQPLLPREGDILTSSLLCQLSFFLPSTCLWYCLRPLYSGSTDGFSINSFEQKVLNWRAPTVILVSGTRSGTLSSSTDPLDTLPTGDFPSRRFKPGASGNTTDDRVVFGAYINVPWQHTQRSPFGDEATVLFQLAPLHDIFRASTLNRDYVTLTNHGVAFGSPVPRSRPALGLSNTLPLGAVSLNVDSSLENAVFMHDSAGGGAFGTTRAQRGDFEERFEVEHVEVWGCGGDDVAREQKERWAWEEKEAAARRGLMRLEDKDANYALLEMAGLVGQNRSGGSIA